MKKIYLMFLVLFIFIGCVTTITTRMVNQPIKKSIEDKKFLDSVSYVLTENGFEIKMINETTKSFVDFILKLEEIIWQSCNNKDNSKDAKENVITILNTMPGIVGGIVTKCYEVNQYKINNYSILDYMIDEIDKKLRHKNSTYLQKQEL